MINGNNFSPVPAGNTVYFGGVKANVTAASPTQLSATVPVGANYAPLTVTVNNLTAYSANKFSQTFRGGGMLFSEYFFEPKIEYQVGQHPLTASAVDFDGDGRLDIPVMSDVTKNMMIYRNDSYPGNLVFTKAFEYRFRFLTFFLHADFNGDGKIDICTVNPANIIGIPDSITVLINNSVPGNFIFTSSNSFVAGKQPLGGSAGDLDADGKPDLAFICTDGTMSVLRNTSNLSSVSFGPIQTFPLLPTSMRTSITDLNDDQKPELVVCNIGGPNAAFQLFRNNSTPGNISFSPRFDYITGISMSSLDASDYNSDNKPDLLGAGSLDNLACLRNISTGTYAFDQQLRQVGRQIMEAKPGDINGDGKPDIISGNIDRDTCFVLLRNTSTSREIKFSTGSWFYSAAKFPNVYSGDLDGDGLPDIYSANSGTDLLSIHRNLAPACHWNVQQYPYKESFESSEGQWFSGGDESDWEWGSPSKSYLNNAGEGNRCWTNGNTTGNAYLRNQGSWLRSPCFDLSSLTDPEIAFRVFWDAELAVSGANLQYSLDSGISWQVLGQANSNYGCRINNWYNQNTVSALNNQPGWSGSSHSSTGGCPSGNGSGIWLTARHDIRFLAGQPKVIFRFYFSSGSNCNDYDGFAIDDFQIREFRPVSVNLGKDTTVCGLKPYLLQPGKYASYLWQDNNTAAQYQVFNDGLYYVTVADSTGCTARDSVNIQFKCNGVFFPNAFTPNNDGLNDWFGPTGDIDDLSKYRLTVYGRWGQVIFRSDNPFEKWNGHPGSFLLESQVFVWIATYNYGGRTYFKKGTVTLIR